MTDDKKRIDSFSRFLRRRGKKDRSGHMAWGPDDVEMHEAPDRTDHFSWGPDDVEFHTSDVNEEASVKDDYSHLQNLPVKTVPHDKADFDWSHIHDDQVKHRETYTPEMKSVHNDYKGWSPDFNEHLREPSNHRDNGKIAHRPDKYWGNGRSDNYQNMDKITSHPLSHDITGYRGFGRGFDVSKLKPGEEFTDHGYTGITHKRSVASKEGGQLHYGEHPLAKHFAGQPRTETIAMVHVPKGTRGHLLDMPYHQHTGIDQEGEFTLGRGTRFRVGKHEIHDSPVAPSAGLGPKRFHVVHLHVVGQNPKEIEEE